MGFPFSAFPDLAISSISGGAGKERVPKNGKLMHDRLLS